MPIYQMTCDTCQTSTEEFLHLSEVEQFTCPTCSGPTHRDLCLPTSEVSPKYREMYQQAQSMRNKILGKTPFRKYSESQVRNG
jgi:putative FmdB family regulatory protein